MAANLAALRSRVELALAGRVAAPFSYRDRKLVETVSAGIPEIDSLTGGLPRGGLTEICGPPCSGRSTLLVSALAERTAHAEVCALVDGRDAFDPQSAEAAGVELQKLLWVRCQNIGQVFRAADLLLQGGGFGFVAVDLTGMPPETVRYVPLNAWFRLRRAVEDTSTVLMVLEQEANAKTCASLVLQLESIAAYWSSTKEACGEQFSEKFPSSISPHSLACLFDGLRVHVELLRSRIEPLKKLRFGGNFTPLSQQPLQTHAAADTAGFFESKISGNYLDGAASPPTQKPKSKGVLQLR